MARPSRPMGPAIALAVLLCLTVPAAALPLATPTVALGPDSAMDASASAPLPGSGPYATHPPIVILNDAMFTPANGVVSGSGTAADPYVIAGWQINGSLWAPTVAGVNPFPPAVYLDSTSAYVVIRGNLIEDSPSAQVWLKDAAHVSVEGNLLVTHAGGQDPSPNQQMVEVQDSNQVVVRDNTLIVGHHAANVAGIVAASTTASPLKSIVVDGNRVELRTAPSGSSVGIGMSAADASITDNVVTCDAAASGFEGVGAHWNGYQWMTVTITGNGIHGCGADAGGRGIRVGPKVHATVSNNAVSNATTGILVETTRNVALADDTVANVTTTLTLSSARHVAVSNLKARGCTLGVSIDGGRYLSLRDTALSCSSGMTLQDAEDASAWNVTATSFHVAGGARILLANATLQGTGGTGIAVSANATSVAFTNITLTGYHVGVAVSSAHATLRCVDLGSNALGLDATHGAQVSLHRSTVAGNTDGVFAEGSGVLVNATDDWWGNATGPSGAFGGSGDSAQGVLGASVLVDPWLAAPLGCP